MPKASGTSSKSGSADSVHALALTSTIRDQLAGNMSAGELKLTTELIETKVQLLNDIRAEGWTLIQNLEATDKSLLSLMSLLGVPVADKNEGRFVMDLKPDPKSEAEATTSYYSWNRFDFHTDLSFTLVAPRLIAVACVQSDLERRGLTVLSDSRMALSALQVEEICELEKPQFIFTPPTHYRASGPVMKPILIRNQHGSWNISVRFDKVESKSDRALQALRKLRDALDENAESFLLRRDEAYLVDNWRIVHGRTEFSPRFDGTDRHLKRIYGDLTEGEAFETSIPG